MGILIAAATYLVVGVISYSRWGLGRYWEKHISHMRLDVPLQNFRAILGAFVSAIVVSYFMGIFQNIMNVEDILTGAFVGLLVWIGFIWPTIFSPVLFGRKPIQMFWLDSLYYFIVYIAIGAITAGFLAK